MTRLTNAAEPRPAEANHATTWLAGPNRYGQSYADPTMASPTSPRPSYPPPPDIPRAFGLLLPLRGMPKHALTRRTLPWRHCQTEARLDPPWTASPRQGLPVHATPCRTLAASAWQGWATLVRPNRPSAAQPCPAVARRDSPMCTGAAVTRHGFPGRCPPRLSATAEARRSLPHPAKTMPTKPRLPSPPDIPPATGLRSRHGTACHGTASTARPLLPGQGQAQQEQAGLTAPDLDCLTSPWPSMARRTQARRAHRYRYGRDSSRRGTANDGVPGLPLLWHGQPQQG